MRRTLTLTALALAALTPSHAADWTKLRRIAQAAGCAASMIDAASTVHPGIVETNPLLGAGRPGAGRIVGLKIGLCATSFAFAEIRHYRAQRFVSGPQHDADVRAERTGAFVGAGAAAVFGALAAHNAGLR